MAQLSGPPLPEMEALIRWLSSHIPAGDVAPRVGSIAHGDYRLDNLVMAPGGPPGRVAAVLDWELSTLGDPLADLAYNCMPYHLPQVNIETSPTSFL